MSEAYIEYIYTGRLWVLPFSRQYEFRPDDKPMLVTWGFIDETLFTTEQLERLTPGARYMVEFEGEPSYRAGDDGPSLYYIREVDGSPVKGAS